MMVKEKKATMKFSKSAIISQQTSQTNRMLLEILLDENYEGGYSVEHADALLKKFRDKEVL